jgi:hypothetical protein
MEMFQPEPCKLPVHKEKRMHVLKTNKSIYNVNINLVTDLKPP